MIPIKHIDPDDLALYAMQLLPPDEMEEITLHLQHSSEARRVLSEMYGDLSVFAHSAEMHDPPPMARQRLMKHVAREKKAVPIDIYQTGIYAARGGALSLIEEEPPRKSAAARILPWTGWALAAGLAAGSAFLYQQREQMQRERDQLTATVAADAAQLRQAQSSSELANTLLETMRDSTAVHATLTSTGQKAPPQGRISYVTDKGSLILLASNLEPLHPDKVYELWLIPTDGHPIPAGTFRPDTRGNASLVLPELPKGVTAKAFGVTIEDGEGSQIPTMPIVLSGTAS